jgi:hypothetical protein
MLIKTQINGAISRLTKRELWALIVLAEAVKGDPNDPPAPLPPKQ